MRDRAAGGRGRCPAGAAGRLGVVVTAALLSSTACPPGAAAEPARTTGSAPGLTATAQRQDTQVTSRDVAVRAADGTPLAGTVYEPSGPGPHPLLVVPGAWFSLPADDVETALKLRALAASGYVVVSYDPRGFRRSGGEADLAGPADTSDLSRVIDWALDHSRADARRVGALGSSYGAGIALNAAAHDGRVRAVAALSGWADMSGGYYVNGTRAASITFFQGLVGRLHGRYGPEAEAAFTRARVHGIDESDPWARTRSPRAHVERFNRHRTAVFMAGEWDDPLVPAGPTGAFLDELEGPRQLQMYPGGHGDSRTVTARLGGGEPMVWEQAVAWLDSHVRDRGRRFEQPAPVVLAPRTGGPVEKYPAWRSLQHHLVPVALRPRPGTGRLTAGLPSAAESGPYPVAGKLDQAGTRLTVPMPLLTSPAAAVWQGDRLPHARALRGSAHVRGVLVPGAGTGTVIGHLYDVGPLDTARLLTHAPYTFRGQVPGRPHAFSFAMPATAWDLPAGHRLALVFDTVDHRYAGENPLGTPLTIVPSSVRLSAPLAPGRPPFTDAPAPGQRRQG
ncbi:alpha/beta fold hydrolase [Streptomyces sp. NPDC006285]|uniref:S15 peptidase family protein n=1 Tax=Streptomyces sp. NPDC006285 TaxID=3364742 RepID=UPI0036D14290